MKSPTLALGCAALLALPLFAEKFHLNPAGIVPAATGQVDVNRDNNGNTRMDVKVDHLALPASLSPSKTTYVVWAQGANTPPENLGELKVGDHLKGELKTTTAQRDFELLVTAENNPRTSTPTGPVVLQANIRQTP
jgi:hypothetical protein